ncbi:hypothetical protein H632_c1489p1 [Helicosporidium sp. ATCC 50920]|nr:hypothetical protein H632_c1489p1 [Helicosporidium sp. ATCC 50920]|eukprot:KDD74208.1 hypothetical protein H632_c1489p1 [Helicosporidium sp. ATCC 50920]
MFPLTDCWNCLLSECGKTTQSVSLPTLAAAVDLAPGSELEALLINHCIYEGLVEGIIDQDSNCFVVQRLAPRDVAPSELPKLAQELAAWMDSVDAAVQALEENAALAMQADADKSRVEGEYAKKVVQELESVRLALDIEAAEDEPSTQVAELDTFANPGSNDETPPGLPRHSKRRR